MIYACKAGIAVADHQGLRNESRCIPRAEVGDLPAQRVEKRPVNRYTRIRRSQRPIADEDDQAGDKIPYSISPQVTLGEISLLESVKSEAPADNLEAQFRPVTNPSVSAFIETVDMALMSDLLSPASEPQVITPNEM